MGDSLTELKAEYDQDNQDTKRSIGEYLHGRPSQWIAQQELASEFDIDVSGVSKHLKQFEKQDYIETKEVNDEKYAQWIGRGAGGIRYWADRIIPGPLWEAGRELRLFVTLDRLGGAFLPTLLFGFLMILGLVMGVMTYLIAEFELESVVGYTARDILVFTGICTMMASVLLLAGILWRLLVWGVAAGGLVSESSEQDSADAEE